MSIENSSTIGSYVASRLKSIGVENYFAIPGDYNLVLLDELLKEDSMTMINCCNELNAGYAADGYARATGVGVFVTTFSVGGLSCVNAVAGAYAENLPLIIISGGPNTNSLQENEILHHSLGVVNYGYVREIYSKITAHSVIINNVESAGLQIDKAIEIGLKERKPVYIEIACNIANAEISVPSGRLVISDPISDSVSFKEAVADLLDVINNAVKPVIVVGSKIRGYDVHKDIESFSTASKFALANMPDGKGFISEEHSNYIGTYWGPVSSPGCGEVVESSDCYIFIGPNFTDYTTVGQSAHLQKNKLIEIFHWGVKIHGRVYTNINMKELLDELIKKVKPNNKSYEVYKRISGRAPLVNESYKSSDKVSTRYLFSQIEAMLSNKTAVLAETGDSWFNGERLQLPKDCLFEIQMQYGSIGWSVGALLGYQLGLEGEKRVIGLIGDGSFQMTAQEISTMIRYNVAPIIFLMNNNSYTIEVQIHDGLYNEIKNWNYADLVKVFNSSDGNGWSAKVKTCEQLKKAIAQAKKYKDRLCFIEVILDPDDCNKSLLEWGSRVAAWNARKPNLT